MKLKILTILLIFAMTSCGNRIQLKSDKYLTKSIIKQLKINQQLDFSNIDNINADTILIIGPYTHIDNLQEKLQLDLRNIAKNGIYYSDYYNLIVLIKDRKPVAISEITRAYGDFIPVGVPIPISKAKFKKTLNTTYKLY